MIVGEGPSCRGEGRLMVGRAQQTAGHPASPSNHASLIGAEPKQLGQRQQHSDRSQRDAIDVVTAQRRVDECAWQPERANEVGGDRLVDVRPAVEHFEVAAARRGLGQHAARSSEPTTVGHDDAAHEDRRRVRQDLPMVGQSEGLVPRDGCRDRSDLEEPAGGAVVGPLDVPRLVAFGQPSFAEHHLQPTGPRLIGRGSFQSTEPREFDAFAGGCAGDKLFSLAGDHVDQVVLPAGFGERHPRVHGIDHGHDQHVAANVDAARCPHVVDRRLNRLRVGRHGEGRVEVAGHALARGVLRAERRPNRERRGEHGGQRSGGRRRLGSIDHHRALGHRKARNLGVVEPRRLRRDPSLPQGSGSEREHPGGHPTSSRAIRSIVAAKCSGCSSIG